jgi:membrane dipeptidase
MSTTSTPTTTPDVVPHVVWDNHACMPLRADDRFLPQLDRFRRAGVDVVSLNIGFADVRWQDHIRVLSHIRRWIALHSDDYSLVSTVQDILEAKSAGKLGIVFDIEGMGPVLEDISLVQTFYELGARWMLIAYNQNNAAGGGCMDEDTGLTTLGRAIIDEMARVGMVLCLSHAGARTVADALEYSSNPPIFSHSNPYGDHAHVRNVSDQLLQACAEKGGVIGISGIGLFLGANEDVVPRLLRQIQYLVDLVGADHVGLGLDYVFDRTELDDYVRLNPSLFPPGAETMSIVAPEAMSEIREGLARFRLSECEIAGILGNNWMRIATRVWK